MQSPGMRGGMVHFKEVPSKSAAEEGESGTLGSIDTRAEPVASFLRKPRSPSLQADSLPTELPGKP